MEREKIVAELFQRGHLLTEEALKIIEEKGMEEFSSVKLPTVVRASDLRVPYKILKNLTAMKGELGREDFVKFYNSKYEKMRDLILGRLPKDYVSLNKIDSTRSEVHVIGIVREIKEKEGKKVIELEDKTATVPVIFEDIEDAELDDVIAVRAISGGKVLFGKKVLYPDIPLRPPVHGEGKACFVSNLHVDEAPVKELERFFEWFGSQDAPYLFVAGGIGDRTAFERLVDRHCYMKTVFVIADGDGYPGIPQEYSSTRIVSLSNPAMVEVGGLKVLVIKRADTTALKKRYLGKSNIILDEDYLVLDEIPDIVHSGGSDTPSILNYKSVTLVNAGSMLGEFRPIVVDFATRDVEKITIG
jgi:DNA polymerase II small subunit